MIAALLATSDDALQVINDALTNHSVAGYVVAGLAALVLIVPLVLKAFGKSVPVLDPILDVILGVLKVAEKPKPAPAPTDAEKAAEPGVGNVVEIKKLDK